ncbi:MAG: hypothetical protein ACK5X0_00925 [Rhodospirillales bacterium]|jgi:hypothetical protein
MRGPGFSLWPTPTAIRNGNHVWMQIGPRGLRFVPIPDAWQTMSISGAALAWSVLWDVTQAAGGARRSLVSESSRPVLASLWPGRIGSAYARTLNPRFLEALMGWPDGWTDPASPVTGFSHWLQRMRTELSTVPLRQRT